MSEDERKKWAVKLPFYFALYHTAVVAIVMIFQSPILLGPLELPVVPLLIILLGLADKGILSPPNFLAIPILFSALLALWIAYGVIIGRWIDRRIANDDHSKGTSHGQKFIVIAVLFVLAALLSFAKR